MPSAKQILDKAAEAMDDRAAERDSDQERSMSKIVTCFNAATGNNISERDGWMFLVMLKAVRACTTETGKLDDYVDGGAYFALAGESATTGD